MDTNDIGASMMNLMETSATRNPENPWVKLNLTESEYTTRKNSEKAIEFETAISNFVVIKRDNNGMPIKMKDHIKMKYLGRDEWECFVREITTAWAKHHDAKKLNKKTWDEIHNHVRIAYKAIARVTANPEYLPVSRDNVKNMFDIMKGYKAVNEDIGDGKVATFYTENGITQFCNVISEDIHNISIGATRFDMRANEKVSKDCVDNNGTGYKRGTLDESDE